MESLSAPSHRGLVPWQGLLLAASLLTFWSLPTTAQLTIESVPPNAAEGKDVLLRVHNLPGNLGGYAWYKGEIVDSNHKIVSYVIDTQKITYGPAYSDREKIYPNGSLLFQNVTRKDTGYYILLAIDKNFQSRPVTGQLHVYPELPKPSITSNISNPEEYKDPVMLTCEPQIQNIAYLWLVSSQKLQASARLQLSKDNRTLTLLPVTRNDMGPYECETRNPVSAGRSDPFILNVLYGPDVPLISPSDSHYLPGANLSLFCLSTSNPPAQYSWLVNGRPQQPTQELFIPNITAHDSGSYTCLAHNSVTGLNRTTVKTITVSEQNYKGYSVGTIIGSVIGVLVVVALGASLGYFLYLRRTRRASDCHGLQEHPPPAATPGECLFILEPLGLPHSVHPCPGPSCSDPSLGFKGDSHHHSAQGTPNRQSTLT
ncbi:LOW QUALITY PROTEIN: carcinoembryonic antigen-related cell adhesion molecule 8-like [Myotis lucifugus]|uniref:LOW QUALITY PROTEIN: carcinoembryonic antigen-related cell adhesion molecule 8-like n=1 Tax=Myotis lucifugus TaxID=59463 RepID=UPI000CCBF4B7|nr:LOW QUALITY PROTEIN: carcinoembryonic antigen-related cell adhesion molecule 8-like [Myotis lucifugus]